MAQIIENDDIQGVQRLILRLAAAEGISIFELAERTGLHPTTLYAILKKKPSGNRRPVRRDTIRSLADGNRYTVTFDAMRKRLVFDKAESPEPRNEVQGLLEGLRGVLARSGRRKFTDEEKQKILNVMEALISRG